MADDRDARTTDAGQGDASRRDAGQGDAPRRDPRGRLGEVAALFFRLGLTSFGGPAAHIAVMEHEIVRRRAWLGRDEFLDLLGATNLIPGPNSTELAIHIGRRRAGWPGLVVAGACFILPAAVLTLALAWLYARFGARPSAAALLYGVKPVMIAVVLQALVALTRTAAKTRGLAALGLVAVAAVAAGVDELTVLLGAGAVTAAARRLRDGRPAGPSGVSGSGASGLLPWLGAPAGLGAAAAPAAASLGAAAAPAAAGLGAVGLLPLFLVFLKIGAILFGSGYVLLAFLRTDLVERLHWISEAQLLDAVAIGQLTPGPVLSTATFIGFLAAGWGGAAVATGGIFLPSFVFVAASAPLLPRLRRSRTAGAFLDGVNVASLALMAVVTASLGRAAVVDVPSALFAATAALLLLRYRVNSALLVVGSALAGLAIQSLR